MGDNAYSKGFLCTGCKAPRTNRSRRCCAACERRLRKYTKGLRCLACGGQRSNYSGNFCSNCYERGQAPIAIQSVISPWETLPNGDRVRTLRGV